MTAVAVLSGVRERLEHLLSDEFSTVRSPPSSSLRHQVNQLISKLTYIQNFLITNTNYKSQAVNLAYEVEDAIEFVYLLESQPPKWLPFKLSSPIKTPLNSLCSRIDKLIHLMEQNSAQPVSDYPKIDFSDTGLPSEAIVGMKEAFESLEYLLLNEDERYPLASTCISICGMGGVGKTTLARKLFDSSSVAMKFPGRVWVQVTNTFEARDIAGSILRQLSESNKEEEEGMETTELMERLYKAQQGRRCLIVLDDVWNEEAWETIRFAFALDQGTRIILTTRIVSVARMGMMSKMGMGYMHQMKLLNEEQSWELFSSQLHLNDLVAIGKQQKEVKEIIVKNVTSRL